MRDKRKRTSRSRTFWVRLDRVVFPRGQLYVFSPVDTVLSRHSLNRSGCVFQDGIIKVITDIRSDMRSSPLQDEQKLFLRQEMVCRGGTDSAPVCCSALLEGAGEAAGLRVRTVSDQQRRVGVGRSEALARRVRQSHGGGGGRRAASFLSSWNGDRRWAREWVVRNRFGVSVESEHGCGESGQGKRGERQEQRVDR